MTESRSPKPRNRIHHPGMHLIRGSLAVNHPTSPRGAGHQLAVALGDGNLKVIPGRFNAISDALRAATDPAERKRLWLALLDEYEAEAPALILYPVQEVIGKRRSVGFTHYPLYYFDGRAYNLSFA